MKHSVWQHKMRQGNWVALVLVLVCLPLLHQPRSEARSQGRGQSAGRKPPEQSRPTELYGESHALVIGVSRYTAGLRSLPGVRRDVAEVALALQRHGFQVTTVEDPTYEQFDQAMRSFIARRGHVFNARLVIYYAGHGETLPTADGRPQGYLAPTDAPSPQHNRQEFEQKAIGMSQIEGYAKRLSAKHALFIFDSCFSGMVFLNRSSGGVGGTPPSIENKLLHRVRQFITAGTEEQTVPDDSVFRKVFVRGLEGEADLNGDGYVTGSELGAHLEDQVTNYTQKMQTPVYGKIRDPELDRGDIIFDVRQSLAARALEAERAYWAKIENSPRVEDFQQYLATFGQDGAHAETARRRLRAFEAQAAEEQHWRRIENSRNAQDFRAYLAQHGERARHATAALANARHLESLAADDAHWQRIENSVNTQDFALYITRYGKSGRHYQEALAKKARLEERAADRAHWRRIQTSGRAEDFRAYLQAFGAQALFYEEAQAHLAKIDAAARESAAWQRVATSRRPQELRDYLQQYPDGSFAAAAKRRLAELETATSKPPLSPPAANASASNDAKPPLPKAATGNSPAATSAAPPRRTEPIKDDSRAELPPTVTNTATGDAAVKETTRPPAPPPLSLTWTKVATIVYSRKETLHKEAQVRVFTQDLGNDVTLEMVEVRGNSFLMGSPATEPLRNQNEGPQQRVTVSTFLLGRYEVTQAQWRAVAGLPKVKIDLPPEPSKFSHLSKAIGDAMPVESVTWEEAVEFCERLSRKTGRLYRLPSEAEWEFGCRAYSETPFYFGEMVRTEIVNFDGTTGSKLAPKGSYRNKPVVVGSLKMPNLFGLFDMHGNVAEWCADAWVGHYNGIPDDGTARRSNDPQAHRVVRGGNWFKQAQEARSAARYSFAPNGRAHSIGFRVALTP